MCTNKRYFMNYTQFRLETALYMLDTWEQILAQAVFLLFCIAFSYYSYYWLLQPVAADYWEPIIAPALRSYFNQFTAARNGGDAAAAAPAATAGR